MTAQTYMTRAGIRAVILTDSGKYVAQCLERDIGAQADSLEDVRERLECALLAHVAACHDLKRSWFEGVSAAPKRFFDMWDA